MDCASLFLTMHGIGLLQSDFGPTAVKMTAYPYGSTAFVKNLQHPSVLPENVALDSPDI